MSPTLAALPPLTQRPVVPLVPITPASHWVTLEIAYATANNFTGAPVYARPACYLHPDAEAALRAAVRRAAGLGLRLRVYDAYRPTEAQQALWNHTPDPEFLAPPERGSAHSRGVAVDLTLEHPDGTLLDMGTPFDSFTPLSHHGVTEGISVEGQRNRLILLGIMTASGWDWYTNEWWHYQLFHARSYPLLSDADAGTGMMP